MFTSARAQLLAIVVAAMATPVVFAQSDPLAPIAELPRIDAQRLEAQLLDGSLDVAIREEAARRLVNHPFNGARPSLRRILSDPRDAAARLAVARALANDATPDATLIEPFFAMLDPGSAREFQDAAAAALATYVTQPQVATRLATLSSGNGPESLRLLAIRSLGAFAEKKSAQTLVELLSDPSPAITAAATSALVDMTGRVEPAGEAGWRAWWQSQQSVADAAFRELIFTERARRLEIVDRRTIDLVAELSRGLTAEFRQAPAGQRGPIARRTLTSPLPEVRAIGMKLIYADLTEGGRLDDDNLQLVRDRLSDSDAQARAWAARTVQFVNDAKALEPIVRQITVEQDPAVKAILVDALKPISDVRTMPLILSLLSDPATPVVRAAASVLETQGRSLATGSPQVALQASTAISAAMDRFSDTPANFTVRESLLGSLVQLRQRSQLSRYTTLLTGNPRQPDAIRRLALVGLGLIGEAETSDLIVEMLSDPSPLVRQEALTSLSLTADSFAYAEAVSRRLEPANESDAATRDKAWQTLVLLFPKATTDQLDAWAERFRSQKQPERQLATLQASVKLVEGKGNSPYLTFLRQQIGDVLMDLSRFGEAATQFELGLTQARGINRPELEIIVFTESLLRARIRAGDFEGVTKVANEMLSVGSQYQQPVGAVIRTEIETMEKSPSRRSAASRLIEVALKFDPGLAHQYQVQLRDAQKRLKANEGLQNFVSPGDWPSDFRFVRKALGEQRA